MLNRENNMNEYTTILALAYFKEHKEHYLLSELMEILGFNRRQMDGLIYDLLNKNLICYSDGMINLTDTGLTFMIANNHDDSDITDDSFNMVKIDPKTAMSIDTPYVPQNFTKKYDR